MAVYFQGPTVKPSDPTVVDTLSAISAAIPTQIAQTRQQLASQIARAATPVALVAASASVTAPGVAAAASSLVSELAMSAAEKEVYAATAPSDLSPDVKGHLVRVVKQEVLNSSSGIEVSREPHDESSQTKKESTPFGDRVKAEPEQNSTGLLDEAFGSTAQVKRERELVAAAANRSILPPRIRSLI